MLPAEVRREVARLVRGVMDQTPNDQQEIAKADGGASRE